MKRQIDQIMNERYFAEEIKQSVRTEFYRCLNNSIRKYFEYGDGKDAIDEAIKNVMLNKDSM